MLTTHPPDAGEPTEALCWHTLRQSTDANAMASSSICGTM